jgi:hypothetical protein
MRTDLTRPHVMQTSVIAVCAAAAISIGSAAAGLAAGGTFTRGCAARDLQIMMMLETNTISPHRVNDAVRTMMHARMMCLDGQVVDALAVYDDIAQSITSDWVLFGQGP